MVAFVPSRPVHLQRGACLARPLATSQRRPRFLNSPTPTPATISTPRMHAQSTANVTPAPSWLTSSGGTIAPAVNPTPTITRLGLGLTVNASVLKGTELLAIPDALCLTPKIARAYLDRVLPGAARPAVAALSDEAALAAALAHHRSAGPASDLAPLLGSLPPAVDAPAVWSDAQLALLRGSPVLDRARAVRAGLEAERAALAEALSAAGTTDDDLGWLAPGEYAWAASVVDARAAAASSAEPLVLAPVLHTVQPADPGAAGGANSDLRVDGGGIFFAKRRFVLTATRDLEAGEAVTIDTGGRNAELLLERGTAFAGAAAAEAELSFEVAGLDRFLEDKRDVLEMVGLEANATFSLTLGVVERAGIGSSESSGGVGGERRWEPAENMDAFLRLVCLTGGDAFLLEGVFRGEVWEHMMLPVSADNETAVCELVIGAVEDALDGYGEEGSTKDGEAENEEGYRTWLAERLVGGEREVLGKVKEHYERQLQSVDALEYYAERRLNALDLLRPVDEDEVVDSESGARASRAFDEYY